MIKKTTLLAATLLGLTTTLVGGLIEPTLADKIRQVQVQFKPGTSSTIKEGTIKGYDTVDYILNAKKGQTMNVSMTSTNSANYFNIIEPGQKDVAIFNSSMSGNQFEQVLKKNGNYKIRVYLMRSAARNNETGKYRLEMIVN